MLSRRHFDAVGCWVWWFPQGFMTFLSHARSWRKRPPGKRHADMPTCRQRGTQGKTKFFVFCLMLWGWTATVQKQGVLYQATAGCWFHLKKITPRLGKDPFSQIFSDGLKPPTRFLWNKWAFQRTYGCLAHDTSIERKPTSWPKGSL